MCVCGVVFSVCVSGVCLVCVCVCGVCVLVYRRVCRSPNIYRRFTVHHCSFSRGPVKKAEVSTEEIGFLMDCTYVRFPQ